MDKKGISPMIATVLLISFAVALGVVIMNFGRAQVESEAECAIDIGLKFSEIGGKEDYCFDTATQKIKFTVENGINIKIEGLIVNVIGTTKAETYELNDAKLSKAGTYVSNINYNNVVSGDIRQFKITPKVVLHDEELICLEKALIVESISNC